MLRPPPSAEERIVSIPGQQAVVTFKPFKALAPVAFLSLSLFWRLQHIVVLLRPHKCRNSVTDLAPLVTAFFS